MTYEQLDHAFDADSDSDDEIAEQAHLYRSTFIPRCVLILRTSPIYPQFPGNNANQFSSHTAVVAQRGKEEQAAKAAEMPPTRPPRPIQPADLESESEEEDEEDENDPFADRNVISTPGVEQGEPKWH